ncbi:MAG: hypothetical protein JOZ42_12790 [Acetobacteraceae bacterium]|nr:hypothetical protein [Acetobacteraceae bacterium]
MGEYQLTVAAFVFAMVAVGLIRLLRGPGDADRMAATQLLGTGGGAVLLLLAAATAAPSLVNVALILSLLAAFASATFGIGVSPSPPDGADAGK